MPIIVVIVTGTKPVVKEGCAELVSVEFADCGSVAIAIGFSTTMDISIRMDDSAMMVGASTDVIQACPDAAGLGTASRFPEILKRNAQ